MKCLSFFTIGLFLSALAHAQCSGIEQWKNPAYEVKRLSKVFATSENMVYAVDWDGGLMKTANSGNAWERKELQGSDTLRDLHFINSDHGWVVGHDGAIFQTTDGGNSWKEQYQNTSQSLKAIQFTDAQNGWAIGNGGMVLHTNDSGQNWQQQALPDSINPSAFHFTGPNNGWLTSNDGDIWHTNNGGDQWSLQDTSKPRLNDIHFASQDSGWAVGNNGTILHTSDGGKSWQKQGPDTNVVLNNVHFIDGKEGWIVGYQYNDWPKRNVGILMQTQSGGQNWSFQESNTTNAFSSIHFINEEQGWIAGPSGMILQTENGGKQWKLQNCSFHNPPRNLKGGLHSVDFANDQTGWAAGSFGNILKTTNGGETWQFVGCKLPTDYFVKVHFEDLSNGWAIGCINKGGFPTTCAGQIFKTNNGGTDWEKQGEFVRLYDLNFIDKNQGWAVGRHGAIYRTNDGGRTWDTLNSGISKRLRAVKFANENIGWAAGGGYNGVVLKTEDGGENWDQVANPDFTINDIDVINKDTVMMMGGGNLYTIDGGNTWESTAFHAEVKSVKFFNEKMGIAVGEKILKTINGGKRWWPLSYSGQSLYGAGVTGKDEVWAVGEKGTIVKISDPAIPEASFDYETNGVTAEFTNTSSNASEYEWMIFADSLILRTGAKLSYNFEEVGTYKVCLNVSNECTTFGSQECKEIEVTNTSIKTQNRSSIEFYPNPAKDEITLEKGEQTGQFSLKLVNPQGQSVLKTSISKEQKSLDVSHLPQGIYFVKIKSPDQSERLMEKIVVE